MQRRHFLQAAGAVITAANIPFDIQAGNNAKGRALRFAFISDIHVKPDKTAETGMAKALQHVQQQKVDFVINGGDCIMDALDADKQKTQTQFDLYNKILQQENRLPVYHCIGNHDVWGWFVKENAVLQQDRLYGKIWATEALKMPKRYYRFQKNNWHFIVLDSTQLNPAGGYIGKVDDEQFEWLEHELPQIPKEDFVCIVSHIPVLSISSGLFFDKTEPNGDLKIQRNLMHSDFLRVKKLFLRFPQVKVCLSGHTHLQDEVEYLGVTYYCNGAISGNWWNGAFQEFEPAYAVIELYKDGTSKRVITKYQ
jgi:3',5'-cyclic-AMP phosphodiesterase